MNFLNISESSFFSIAFLLKKVIIDIEIHYHLDNDRYFSGYLLISDHIL